jgi:hypothetical protein
MRGGRTVVVEPHRLKGNFSIPFKF